MTKAKTEHTAAPRRSALKALGAFAAATSGVCGDPTLGLASTASPDAEIIHLCAQYIEALDTYSRDGGHMESDVDPLWHAVEAVEQQLDGLNACTVEDVVALAKVARHIATQPNGSENFDTSFVGNWPERVILDLLYLYEEG